jgi:hypothetical protein
VPACATFPLVFDVIVAGICGFLALCPFVSMKASAEPHRLYVGQTWDNFALWTLRFTNFVDRPANAWLLRVLTHGYLHTVQEGKFPGGICVPPAPLEVDETGFHYDTSDDPVGHRL